MRLLYQWCLGGDPKIIVPLLCMTQERRTTCVAGKNQRATHPSACLMAGSACYLSRAVFWILPSVACTSHFAPWQGADSSESAAPCGPHSSSHILRVSKSYWAPGSGSQGESVSCRVQITCLVGQRGCKAYPTVQGWSRLSSFPKAATSPCPGVESHVVIRKGNGKATKEHVKGQGTDSCQNWK